MNAEAMAAAKLEKEFTLPECTMEPCDQEILMTNLKKAEEQQNCDGIVDQTLDDHSVVDILALSMEGEQESSKGEEPIELDPKDKGLFNFLKAVSNVACPTGNAFNIGFGVMVYNASGHHATNELQKLLLIAGGIVYMPFSIITTGVVHALEGKANDIDVATGMVFAEISYAFLAICLVAMFVTKVPSFVVVLLFFVVWLLTANWLVSRYHRPRCLYTRLRSMKNWLRAKVHRQ